MFDENVNVDETTVGYEMPTSVDCSLLNSAGFRCAMGVMLTDEEIAEEMTINPHSEGVAKVVQKYGEGEFKLIQRAHDIWAYSVYCDSRELNESETKDTEDRFRDLIGIAESEEYPHAV